MHRLLQTTTNSIKQYLYSSIPIYIVSSLTVDLLRMLRILIGLQISAVLSLRLINSKFSSFSLDSTARADEQSKSGLGWDSHKAIDLIPESLVRTIDGNDTMRRKFEALCRNAQVRVVNCTYDYHI